MATPAAYRAVSSVWIGNRFFPKGEIVGPNDPAVSAAPGAFESIEAATARLVEEATAVPGQKRSRRPRGEA